MGKGGIFIIQQDGRLLPLAEKEHDSEDLLQDLLAKYPTNWKEGGLWSFAT